MEGLLDHVDRSLHSIVASFITNRESFLLPPPNTSQGRRDTAAEGTTYANYSVYNNEVNRSNREHQIPESLLVHDPAPDFVPPNPLHVPSHLPPRYLLRIGRGGGQVDEKLGGGQKLGANLERLANLGNLSVGGIKAARCRVSQDAAAGVILIVPMNSQQSKRQGGSYYENEGII